jgi:hypothetical protein
VPGGLRLLIDMGPGERPFNFKVSLDGKLQHSFGVERGEAVFMTAGAAGAGGAGNTFHGREGNGTTCSIDLAQPNSDRHGDQGSLKDHKACYDFFDPNHPKGHVSNRPGNGPKAQPAGAAAAARAAAAVEEGLAETHCFWCATPVPNLPKFRRINKLWCSRCHNARIKQGQLFKEHLWPTRPGAVACGPDGCPGCSAPTKPRPASKAGRKRSGSGFTPTKQKKQVQKK